MPPKTDRICEIYYTLLDLTPPPTALLNHQINYSPSRFLPPLETTDSINCRPDECFPILSFRRALSCFVISTSAFLFCHLDERTSRRDLCCS